MEIDKIDLCKQSIKAMEEELKDLMGYETSNHNVTLLILQREIYLKDEIEKYKSILAKLTL